MEKWALITGAASGIGLEFAKLLSAEGYKLLLVDKDEIRLETTKQLLQLVYQNQIKHLSCDLGRKKSAGLVFDWVEESGVELDVLVNNAGFGMFGNFAETSWKRESRMLYLHVHTPSLLVKLFLPGMLQRRRGKILNVTSVAAFHPGPFMCMYYSTKSYLFSFSTSVASELKGTGVTVTALCPGITRTGFQQAVGAAEPKIKIGMASAAEVARYGYQAMLEGKMVAVPGFSNKLILFIRRFLTVNFVADQVRSLQIRNRRDEFKS